MHRTASRSLKPLAAPDPDRRSMAIITLLGTRADVRQGQAWRIMRWLMDCIYAVTVDEEGRTVEVEVTLPDMKETITVRCDGPAPDSEEDQEAFPQVTRAMALAEAGDKILARAIKEKG